MAKFLQAPIELYNGLIYGSPAVQEVNLLADTKGLPNASLLGNNSGVTGAGSAISLGTGLAFSGSTIICTVTGGSASLSFSNVAVAGQTTIAADSTADTLTLAGSGGIAITTDATTDALTFDIPDNSLVIAKMTQVPTATFLGRTTAVTGNVEVLTAAQAKTILNLAGTNSGDQTIPTSLPPSGTAGGDLVGAYPNPTLAASGVVAGTYGSATLIPVPVIDAKGRITSISTVAVSSGGSGTVSSVAATAPLAGFTISGSPVTTAGTFVFALSDDLAALEGLAGTGYAKRTAANTWTAAAIPFADIPGVDTGTLADVALTDSFLEFNVAAAANRRSTLDRIGGFVNPATCNGRLTLTTGVPIPSADVSGAMTAYFTPFNGNRIALWDGTRWRLYAFSEISIPAGAFSGTSSNYDVFVYDNAGTLTIAVSAAWTSSTVRADALGLQDGIVVLNSNKTRRHVGTARNLFDGTLADTAANRFVWNRYNPVPRQMLKYAGTANTYNGGYRQWGASVANQVSFVLGEPQAFFAAAYSEQSLGSGFYAIVGLGFDTVVSPNVCYSYTPAAAGTASGGSVGSGIGYHFVAAVQSSGAAGAASFNIVMINGTILM